MDEYDVVVIGGGPGGEVLAGRTAEGGLSTVVVEKQLVGGECAFWGCMPSKGLLRPTTVLRAARRVPGASEAAAGEIDVAAALARRDAITKEWDDASQVQWLTGHGVELVRGDGRLAGDRTVEVATEDGSRSIRARRAVVIATGSVPVVPPIEGLGGISIWDNRDATEAHEVPDSLLVLGGGAVGVELAQAWHSFGAAVTIVESSDRLLSREEPVAGEELARVFKEIGIEVMTGARMTAARRDDKGRVVAQLEDGRALEAAEILVAVGRRPNTGDVGLESVGLEPGKPVEVDDYLRATGVDGGWLYAIGDANGRALFTHMAKYHARIGAEHILGNSPAPAEHHALPRIVFTDPQIAAAGRPEARAVEVGLTVRSAVTDLADVAGATVTGEGVAGTVKLVFDTEREVLVGATFVGPDVGEMLHAATVAIAGEVPLARLRHAVPSFPSLGEVWLTAIEDYDAKAKQ